MLVTFQKLQNIQGMVCLSSIENEICSPENRKQYYVVTKASNNILEKSTNLIGKYSLFRYFLA